TAGTETTGDPTGSNTSGGPQTGLFACDSPTCTLLLVSQTLDDRVDVFDVDSKTLRGRISLDLKPDASGQQIDGNLLDEPYELALTRTDLFVTVGHYPDTDQGSLLRFPRDAFAALPAGGTFATAEFFNNVTFSAGVQGLAHGRREGIFLLPHNSGRLLVGVFANNLQTSLWTTPSELLVIDPADFSAPPASVDLGALSVPCIGAWQMVALDEAMTRIAVACDGSESVAVLTLPDDFGSAPLAEAVAGVTSCGFKLGGGDAWTTQFVAPNGAGGFLAMQTQLAEAPRLWQLSGDCKPTSLPGKDVPPALQQVRLLRQPALLRPAGEGPPLWLVASALPDPGVVVVRGGPTATMCGRLEGLGLLAAANAPWALALDAAGEHLAIGAGVPNNPELSEGKGQVLWATLDRSKEDSCEITATDVVDLNAGRYKISEPETWVRAPNVLVLAELTGGGT
ncbi:MAG TPA: hypothetical protein VGB85_19425, partial [Nannocystis sp.]